MLQSQNNPNYREHFLKTFDHSDIFFYSSSRECKRNLIRVSTLKLKSISNWDNWKIKTQIFLGFFKIEKFRTFLVTLDSCTLNILSKDPTVFTITCLKPLHQLPHCLFRHLGSFYRQPHYPLPLRSSTTLTSNLLLFAIHQNHVIWEIW